MIEILIRKDEEIKKLFYKMQCRQDVADILEISEKSLRYFLYVKRPENQYKKFIIKKRNGSEREICAPHTELKNIQRKLAYILNLIYEPKVCAYGFVKDRNIVQNATNHIKKRWIFNIDLKDFFTQIHFGRVRGVLLKPPYNISEEAATTIAQIACYQKVLPQGAPSSPILTNMVCKSLDNKLILLAKKNSISYSRYADDITFSTKRSAFSNDIVDGEDDKLKVGKELNRIIINNSFIVNKDKVHLSSSITRQEVTGLVVNKFPNVKRQYIKNLRAILHNCKTRGIYSAAISYIDKGLCKNKLIIEKSRQKKYTDDIIKWFKLVLVGKITFIKQIKGSNSFTFLIFAEQLNNLFNEEIFDITILNDFYDRVEKSVVILEYVSSDKSEWIQGSGFLIKDYGLFTNYHVVESNNFFKVYRVNDYDDKYMGVICNSVNKLKTSKEIDYALFKLDVDFSNCFELGDSTNLKLGDRVIIIGYPNYQKGNSPTIQTCEITSKKNYMGSTFYTVGGRIVHGASGGVVLNQDKRVIGIIKGGIVSLADDETNENQGFVPIHIILNDLKDM